MSEVPLTPEAETQPDDVAVPELLELHTLEVPPEQLFLDPSNPRLAVLGQDEDAIPDSRVPDDELQRQVLEELKDGPGIDDVVEKIRKFGFLKIDRIVARPLVGINDAYVVLEGNRRVASIKHIKSNQRLFQALPEHAKESLERIEVLVYRGENPDLAWDIQGLRHIESIKEWGPFQRGRFLVRMQESRGLGPTELARLVPVGRTVINRLIRSYHAFSQAMEDGDYGDQLSETDFSIFQEAIFHRNNSPLWKWLNWDDDSRRFKEEENLTTVLRLLKEREDGGAARISRVNPDLRDKFSLLLVEGNERELEDFLSGASTLDESYVRTMREEEDRRATEDVLDLSHQRARLIEIDAHVQTLPLPKIKEAGESSEFIELLERIERSAADQRDFLNS